MKKIKKYLLLQKEDGLIINFFKICFWLPTVYYFYYSVCTIVSLVSRLINGPSQLPVSINPEQVWLYLTGAYLVLCAVYVLLLKNDPVYKEEIRGATMSEWFDIVDEKGHPTGEIVEREYAHRHGIRHRTAHLWLVREKDGRIQILLQKRSADKDSHPGCYDISSAGHIPAGVDYQPSAIRELKEELGVDAEEKDLVFCGDRKVVWDDCFHGKPFCDRQVSRVFLMWLDLPEEEFTVDPGEVESVRWMDFDECCRGVENNLFQHCIVAEELEILKKALGVK